MAAPRNNSLDPSCTPFTLWKHEASEKGRGRYAYVGSLDALPSWEAVRQQYGPGAYELRDSAQPYGRQRQDLAAVRGHVAPPAAAPNPSHHLEVVRLLERRDAEIAELRAQIADLADRPAPDPREVIQQAVALQQDLAALLPAPNPPLPPTPTLTQQIAEIGPLLLQAWQQMQASAQSARLGADWSAVAKAAQAAGLTPADIIDWIREHLADDASDA